LAGCDLSASLLGVMTGEVIRLANVVRPRHVEGVMDNLDLSAWPDLLGSCWALALWAFACCLVASYATHYLIGALRYPGAITPARSVIERTYLDWLTDIFPSLLQQDPTEWLTCILLV
jgi:hypothetical protein